jgi:transaldolase
MNNEIIKELDNLGQSLWLDFISRDIIQNGELEKLIKSGLMGVTSNPSIFHNAIAKSNDYDNEIKELASKGSSVEDIYDELTVRDIQEAADILKPVYEKTAERDGYISLELNPLLAEDTEKTLSEGIRLHEKVSRENVMFKVPATDEGIVAIEELISRGICVNITLIFSPEQYRKTAEAYIRGLKRLADNKGDLTKVHSVASVFVSRIESMVDDLLEERGREDLMGQAAVANSEIIYSIYRGIENSPEFQELFRKGANLQRVLWASTGTKNSAYSDIKYVTELIAPDTVNTLPYDTLKKFIDHGVAKLSLDTDDSKANEIFRDLEAAGVSMNDVFNVLLKKGLTAFEDAYRELLDSIKSKAE